MLSQLRQQELSTALRLLPADVVKQIGKRHPLLIPPFTNATLRRAVQDYLAGGARKEDIVKKYGEINNWDVSNVTDMCGLFYHPLGTYGTGHYVRGVSLASEHGVENPQDKEGPPRLEAGGSRCAPHNID